MIATSASAAMPGNSAGRVMNASAPASPPRNARPGRSDIRHAAARRKSAVAGTSLIGWMA